MAPASSPPTSLSLPGGLELLSVELTSYQALCDGTAYVVAASASSDWSAEAANYRYDDGAAGGSRVGGAAGWGVEELVGTPALDGVCDDSRRAWAPQLVANGLCPA